MDEYEVKDPKVGRSHPDAERNINSFLKLESKVRFDPSVGLSKMMHGSEWVGMQFAYGSIGSRDGVYILSFHQSHFNFKHELVTIFNKLGFSGLLERIDFPKTYQQAKDGEW